MLLHYYWIADFRSSPTKPNDYKIEVIEPEDYEKWLVVENGHGFLLIE